LAVVLVVWGIDNATRTATRPTAVTASPTAYAPTQIEPTRGTANWWCLSGMKCWHTTEACDDDRRKVLAKNGTDLPCTAVDVAACLEVERILTKERTRECYASISYCKAAVQQWRNTEPDDVKIVVECVPE